MCSEKPMTVFSLELPRVIYNTLHSCEVGIITPLSAACRKGNLKQVIYIFPLAMGKCINNYG